MGHGRCYDLAPDLFGEDDEGYGKVLGDGTVPRSSRTRRAWRRPTAPSARSS
ncbi:ferredoxin [Actinomadura keratinilytica]|uniref:ferredoxin n=1 Tax=Actinomadura keratinilytica TaxID=547461 RepID=UPI00360F4246